MLQLASRLSSGAVLLSSPGWELGLCFPVPLALHSPLTSVPCWPGPTALPCHVGFARSLPSCTWNTQLDLAMGPGALPEKAMLWAEKCKCRSKSHRATSAYAYCSGNGTISTSWWLALQLFGLQGACLSPGHFLLSMSLSSGLSEAVKEPYLEQEWLQKPSLTWDFLLLQIKIRTNSLFWPQLIHCL